jgi:hypothetical protein
MPLKISTSKNHLGTSEKPFTVRTESSGRVEFEELVSIMAEGRTTITAPDIAGTLMLLKEELAKLVADGRYVKTPIGSFHLTACGLLENEDQPFTPGQGDYKHGIRLHYRPGSEFQDLVTRKAQFIRTERFEKNKPVIRSVDSVKTDADTRPGDYVRVNGLRLQFDESDQTQGVFFINGSEHRSPGYAYLDNRTVVAQVPENIEPGPYEVYIRCINHSKELKQGKAELALTVS